MDGELTTGFIEDVVVTSFPYCWDRSSRSCRSLAKFIRSRIEKHKPNELKPEALVHIIVESCMKYNPTFTVLGRDITYDIAFGAEIARVVRLKPVPGHLPGKSC